ncbi:MAG TPA: PrsW family intramembrane metalloprotease [Candidatus Kaiserbacteria bacterium]|nr:PrsW family intramembrane metalloprotease [Candidatus Kaiserbacteria bacterium]
MSIATNIVLIILGGAVPSLVWLYFLLKEGSRFPQPRRVVALAFIAGMFATLLAILFEQYMLTHGLKGLRSTIAVGTIEETMKFALAAFIILWLPVINEPIDYVIYLITVALGFSALENAIYFIHALSVSGVAGAVLNDTRRFVTATLLHIIATSAIGFALAFSYKMQPWSRMLWAAGGVILAITLHTAFDTLIIGKGAKSALALLLVWGGVVVMLFFFEILKLREDESSHIQTR